MILDGNFEKKEKKGQARALGDILSQLRREHRLPESGANCEKDEKLRQAWRAKFGSMAGEYAGRRGDTLLIAVAHPAQRYELEMKKQNMIELLRNDENFLAVSGLRFVKR